MKTFLQNLLIFFALCLCALIAFQWVRETDLRVKVQKLTNEGQDKAEAIQNLNSQVKRYQGEIQRLEAANKDLNQKLSSNDVQIATLSRELDKATSEAERNQKQAEQYKALFEKANDNVRQQNETITKASEEMKRLGEERNAAVVKFNELAGQYKELGAKFQELADKWNAQQEQLARAATNAPPKK